MQSGDRFLIALGTMFGATVFCCGLVGFAAAGALGGVGIWLLSDTGLWAMLGAISASIAWAIFGGRSEEQDPKEQ